jgi:hypothetical protein
MAKKKMMPKGKAKAELEYSKADLAMDAKMAKGMKMKMKPKGKKK